LAGNNNVVNFVRYQSDGTISSTVGGSFAVCDNSDNANNIPNTPKPYTSKLIIVTGIGRIRIGLDVNPKDGIPEKDNKSALTSCITP
jgi:hypothetical protein